MARTKSRTTKLSNPETLPTVSLSKSIFVLAALIESRPVQVMHLRSTMAMNWADGMIGVMPVFDSIESAEKESKGKYQIIQFERT